MSTIGKMVEKIKNCRWCKGLYGGVLIAVFTVVGANWLSVDSDIGTSEFVVAANAKEPVDHLPNQSRQRHLVSLVNDGNVVQSTGSSPTRCIAPSAHILAKRDRKEIAAAGAGYLQNAEYRRPYQPRHSPLTARELKAAKIAWSYFERFIPKALIFDSAAVPKRPVL